VRGGKRLSGSCHSSGDEIQPAEGEPFPLIHLEEGSGYALAVTDPYSRLTRVFRSAPESGPDIWWPAVLEDRNGNEIHYDRAPAGPPPWQLIKHQVRAGKSAAR
jgi:hypothetical protein